MIRVETILTPASARALNERDLTCAVCVMFDVLRASSTMVAALANGATRILPAQEIEDALLLKRTQPRALLAGERGGHRITAAISGSVDFDLGNSPREFTRERVQNRTIIMTTTNGTRALRAASPARVVLVGCFLNLNATAEAVRLAGSGPVLLVGAGTGDGAAYEDTLAAGALATRLSTLLTCDLDDATRMAVDLFQAHAADLRPALARGSNGRRLMADPELRDDVAFCAQVDALPVTIAVADGVATLPPALTS